MQFALTLAFLASIALAQVPTGTSGMPSDACLNGLTSFVTVASNCKIDIMALASSNATFTPNKDQVSCLCTAANTQIISKMISDCSSPSDSNQGCQQGKSGAISTGSYAAAAVVGAMLL